MATNIARLSDRRGNKIHLQIHTLASESPLVRLGKHRRECLDAVRSLTNQWQNISSSVSSNFEGLMFPSAPFWSFEDFLDNRTSSVEKFYPESFRLRFIRQFQCILPDKSKMEVFW